MCYSDSQTTLIVSFQGGEAADWLQLEILLIRIMNKVGNKEQPFTKLQHHWTLGEPEGHV